MNALYNAECGLQIPFSLACGLCWGHSFAATSHSLRSLCRNRHLFWRCLSSRRLPFWILVRPLGLKPPLVRIHRQGEYEVGFYVPVCMGRRPEVYDILDPCSRLWGNFSGSYSSMGAVASPQRRGKVI